MKKHDDNFKIVKGATLIANLSFGLWLGMIITGVIFVYKSILHGPQAVFITIFAAFFVFSIIGSFLNIWAGNKLSSLKLEGTSKELNELAIGHSRWFLMPIMFALSINRVRGAMWDFIITNQTKDIDDPLEKVQEEYKIIDDLKKDGYISEYKYNDLQEKKEERLTEAKKIKQIQDKQQKVTKKEEEEDEWIH